MRARNIFFYFFAFFGALVGLGTAQGALASDIPVNPVTTDTVFPQEASFQYHEDLQSQYTFDSIATLPRTAWQSIVAGKASFGFTSSTYWLRTAVRNDTPEVKSFVLEVDYVLLDDVAFKAIKPNGVVSELSTGDTKPFYPRHIDHPSILFRFQLNPDEHIEVYSRIRTEGSMILPMRIWEEKHFFEAASAEQKVHFYYYGAMSVIILINLAVFFTLRERLYLYYSTAIAGYLMFFATSRGFVHQLFIPHLPDLNSKLFLISMPFLALFSVLFARQFLKTAVYSPKLDLALKGMIAFECFNLAISFFAGYDIAVRISALGAVLLFAVLFFAGPITWYKRKRSGVFFTIAWIPLTIGFFATSGRTSGFLPNNFWTEYAMQIGSGFEAIILTLALADRLYREREKKIKAQAESLKIEKQRNLTQSLLAQTMSRDPITQLSNRNRFEWLVRNTLMAHPERRYFVAVARVTRMDDITRTLGLSSSERLLKHVATQLNNEVVKIDGVITHTNEQGEKEGAYQLSRETFGVFIDQAAFEANPEKFYGVLNAIAEPVELEGLSIELAPNYGSALYPKHGTDPAQLIRNALIALQESRNSKNLMGVYHERLDIYDEGRLTLITQLREALNAGNLALHYQPKVDIRSGEVVGLEALARWVHPVRGFIPPDEFIPLAEEAGLIHQLTLWALEQAISDVEGLREEGYKGSVSVNLSPRDLLVRGLKDELENIIARHSVPPELIFLELTETAAMEDPEVGISTLNAVAALGVKIAIDDFGAGYSSLSYLQRLPAAEIKLDRSLISDINNSESSAVIVKTSIDMVHALGYELVAEGVEDEQTVQKLSEYRCDCFQGYWCCKPLPLAELKEWMRQRKL